MTDLKANDIVNVINDANIGMTAFEIRPATGYNIMSTDEDMLKLMSKRFQMWADFAKETGDHIESYTVSQYGDYPSDPLTDWTLEDIATAIRKYANRMGKNARGHVEDVRDMLKIAHFACTAYHKLNGTEKNYIDVEN